MTLGIPHSFKGRNLVAFLMLINSSTMEDIVDVESELTQRLSGLQKRLEKVAHPDLSHRGDLGKVHELIKANLQRSKVIQDQVNESKVC